MIPTASDTGPPTPSGYPGDGPAMLTTPARGKTMLPGRFGCAERSW